MNSQEELSNKAFEIFARIVSQPGQHAEPEMIAAKCHDLAEAFQRGFRNRKLQVEKEKFDEETAKYMNAIKNPVNRYNPAVEAWHYDLFYGRKLR